MAASSLRLVARRELFPPRVPSVVDHDPPGRGRRRVNIGPPSGMPERRTARRRASDVPKPKCPWCGASTSAVYRSKPSLNTDKYRRRRQCRECGRDWPTQEGLDRELFARELEACGMTLKDLGLDEEAP
jgi:hypothetical protein